MDIEAKYSKIKKGEVMTEHQSNINKLSKMQSAIDTASQEKAVAEGTVQAIMEDLEQHGIKNTKQLSKKIDELDSELESLEKEIAKGVKNLEENYNWG